MEIEFRQIVRTALRLWWLQVVLVLAGGLLGYGASIPLEKTYTASTQVLIPTSLTETTGISEDANRAATFDALIVSGPVLDRVIIELELDLTRDDLDALVTSQITGGGQIIEVTVTNSDPELAADIANSVARNFEALVIDLTTGEFERNLDTLQMQSDQLGDRITVIDTRLTDLDIAENADDSEAQVEVTQLKQDRLKLAQNKADVDATIRDLTSQLSMTSAQVVVSDFARPADDPVTPSPVLLALLGAFLGGLVSVAVLIFLGLRDNRLHDETQLVSLPVVGRSNTAELAETTLAMLANRLRIARGDAMGNVAIVSPRSSDAPATIAAALNTGETKAGESFVVADGLLERPAAMSVFSHAAAAVIVAQQGTTELSDLAETDSVLRSLGVPILGTLFFKRGKRRQREARATDHTYE